MDDLGGTVGKSLRVKVLSVKFCKVNAAEARQVAGKYRVQAVPTLFVFKNGEVADSFVGFQSEQEIRRRVSALSGAQ